MKKQKEITGDDLDADNLIPFMPDSIRKEYEENPDPGIFGFSAGVKRWLETTSEPHAEKWRNDLYTFHALDRDRAIKWQNKAIDLAHQLPHSNGLVRPITVPLHPRLKADMELKDRNAWKDPDSIADTRRRYPKLFIKR